MRKPRTSEFESEFNRAMDLREPNPEEALSIFKDLNKRHPNQAVITGMIAAVYFTYLERYDEALPYARATVMLSPRSEMASLTLFHTLSHLGFDSEALDESRRFTRLNGITPEYEFLFSELDDNGHFG